MSLDFEKSKSESMRSEQHGSPTAASPLIKPYLPQAYAIQQEQWDEIVKILLSTEAQFKLIHAALKPLLPAKLFQNTMNELLDIQAEQLQQQSAEMARIADRISSQAEKTDKLLEQTSQQAGNLLGSASLKCRELTESLSRKLLWLTGKVFLFIALAEALLLTSYLLLKMFLK